ncbi:unnamed protein product [Rotaria magnacalcarata]|uniref:Uncharacterized protein n=2 Tax=Rotaria magnacalcarata TaxID=392030 RepID=A0A814VY65_9BILA|nr:unnamed protein product [Rotaria magnacalcarata]CAF1585699.1 unnamed protein product [Rotaria magnacalcarata]CAF4125527.1 unnamed protein product [Rotaria magnacalcarata]CAF4551174.1 unnamed protein product [Rotaria magnacalcarata]
MKYLPSSLIHLGIYDCFIENIFEQIGKLIRLETLELSNINLINVPNQFINLKNNRQLRSIQMLNGLKSLQILDVRHCSINRLPLYLSRLTNLYMSNNYLINLVGIETLGYENNYKKYFYFDINRIELIPTRIRYVKNLHWLNLNNNYLEKLPKDIFNIMTLRIYIWNIIVFIINN